MTEPTVEEDIAFHHDADIPKTSCSTTISMTGQMLGVLSRMDLEEERFGVKNAITRAELNYSSVPAIKTNWAGLAGSYDSADNGVRRIELHSKEEEAQIDRWAHDTTVRPSESLRSDVEWSKSLTLWIG